MTGRRIYDELVEVTGRDAAVAAVYITLARLEEKGYVASSQTPVADGGKRSLKTFTLESAGAQALRESRDELQRLWAGARLHREFEGES